MLKKDLFKSFKSDGYIKIEKVFNNKSITISTKDISKLKKNVDIYLDQKGSLRRIERLYNKTENLRKINNKIIKLLEKILKKKYQIFKDKFNAKPPGGEGFHAHYDGIFNFKDKNNKLKKGWYEYGKGFVNVLVALDKCTKKNGTIEIAKKHEGGFYNLIKNTKKNFTPDIKPSLEKKIKFQAIELDIGDIVIFSNTCPHRSKKNKTRQHRKTLYYTYLPKEYGFKYNKYFNDKINSKNSTSKSLSGEI